MMYATVVYAAMRGIRSVDTIVDLCKRDLAFIWMTQRKQPKRDTKTDLSYTAVPSKNKNKGKEHP